MLEQRARPGQPDQPGPGRGPFTEQAPDARPVAGHRAEQQRSQARGHPRLTMGVQGAQRAGQPLVLLGQARQQDQVLLVLAEPVPGGEPG